MPNLTATAERHVARPLNVLIPLIKKDVADGDRAGMEYYREAGAKLIEAREGYYPNNSRGFFAWAEREFRKKHDQIRTYMALAIADSGKSFKTLDDFHQSKGRVRTGYADTPRLHREWTAPVDQVAQKARDEARRLAIEEGLTRKQERDAEAKLAMRLIDIGYKVLARELHPDKGGSREAMARLNRVRDRLKECA